MISLENLRESFIKLFGARPRIFRAPGRVNLIGEHVDYNEGFVLPLAIDRFCHAAGSPRSDTILRIYSEQMRETVEFSFDDPRPSQHHWSSYVRGVAWALREAGHKLSGADLLISSDVPFGAGLSSSAALEVASAYALQRLNNLEIDRVELARICQRAENEYVGMRCGIMDQLTASCGRLGNALLIDCRSLEIEYQPIDEARVAVVVANTMVKHALAASSEYNQRREECDEAVERLPHRFTKMRTLRDVSWDEIELFTSTWPEKIRKRARHVTTEIARVHAAATALRNGNYERVGKLLSQSHTSLDQDFEVSSEELNLMVSLAAKLPDFLGGRMTGAGFGGCTVNLVRAANAADFAAALAESYEAQTGIGPDVCICHASNGAEEIS